MYCSKYSAEIPEKTCFLRFGEIKYFSGKGMHKFDGCKDCEEGKKVYETQLKNNKNIKQKPKKAEKECALCERIMGASMFGDGGKNKICIECEGLVDEKKETLKHCNKCKTDKPKGEFYNNANKADGMSAWCKICSKKTTSDYSKSQKEVKKVKVNQDVKINIKKDTGVNKLSIVVDFSKHKDLFERLEIKAEREFRTIEQQILFNCNALTK